MSMQAYYKLLSEVIKTRRVKINGVPVTVRWYNIGGIDLGRKEIGEILKSHALEIINGLKYMLEQDVCRKVVVSPYSVVGELKRRGFEMGEDGFVKRIVDEEHRVAVVVSYRCTETMMQAETLKDISPEDVQVDIIPMVR